MRRMTDEQFQVLKMMVQDDIQSYPSYWTGEGSYSVEIDNLMKSSSLLEDPEKSKNVSMELMIESSDDDEFLGTRGGINMNYEMHGTTLRVQLISLSLGETPKSGTVRDEIKKHFFGNTVDSFEKESGLTVRYEDEDGDDCVTSHSSMAQFSNEQFLELVKMVEVGVAALKM